jgi:phosphoribosylamine--glycine ligase
MVWRLSQNPTIDRLYAAPGNAGIAREATCLPIRADDVAGIAAAVERERIDLTVVGPEVPLVAGLADVLELRGFPVFGPSRAAARIEGSKAWAHGLMERHRIPSARSRAFTSFEKALQHLDSLGEARVVVKADGLAAGKGVTVAEDRDAAVAALRACLVDRKFGEAGVRAVVEERLEGPEVSAFALTDGRDVLPLALAQDFKRAFDGEQGPNTGGMGAYSPVPLLDAETERRIREDLLTATVRAMDAEGSRYRGLLYAGIMVTAQGPKVLEFRRPRSCFRAFAATSASWCSPRWRGTCPLTRRTGPRRHASRSCSPREDTRPNTRPECRSKAWTRPTSRRGRWSSMRGPRTGGVKW